MEAARALVVTGAAAHSATGLELHPTVLMRVPACAWASTSSSSTPGALNLGCPGGSGSATTSSRCSRQPSSPSWSGGRPAPLPVPAVPRAGAVDTPALVPAADDSNAVPDMFVFPESCRSRVAHDDFDLDLPVIDIAPVVRLEALRIRRQLLDPEGADLAALEQETAACQVDKEKRLQELRAACEHSGFFQIVNHGFPMELVDDLRHVAWAFFQRPLEEKHKAASSRRVIGYTSGLPTDKAVPGGGRLWRETFGVRLHLSRAGTTGLLSEHLASSPDRAPRVSGAIAEYARRMEALSLALLEALAESLGLHRATFAGHFRDKPDRTAFFTMNHYPVCPRPDLVLGAYKHSDPFALNIVHQDQVGGLQLLTPDGRWRGVRPVPGALVVNVGDLLQAWTNDRLISSEHRVVANARQSRLSFCFFYNPSKQAIIDPAPGLVDHQHPRRYRSFRAVEFARALDAKGAGGRDRIMGTFLATDG